MSEQTEPIAFVAEVMVLPSGTSPDDDFDVLADFAVTVRWRGPRFGRGYGGYAVTKRGGLVQLSRAGKWAWTPERFRLWQYRWDTLEDAVAAARCVVDDVEVNGRTWRQWVAERERRRLTSQEGAGRS